MMVYPFGVGSGDLFVNEFPLGCPQGDSRFPGKGHSVQTKAVIDARPGLHADGPRGKDVEMEFRGCYPLQVSGIGKKIKDPRSRQGQRYGGIQVMGDYERSPLSVLRT
jgi:hypothetical protein